MGKALNVRLFVAGDLASGNELECDKGQAHYLLNVMRLDEGGFVKLFNGRDGEWSASLKRIGKRGARLQVRDLLRGQCSGPDIYYLFAPLKRARLDYMVQKATEMGVARLCPVLTEYGQVERINLERMQANAVEAAEQCHLLSVPEIAPPEKLVSLLEHWDDERALIFCDEGKDATDPLQALTGIKTTKIAVLIGPEGGFSPQERSLLAEQRFVTPLSLGPRILRADTAAVASLALVNAVVGDWS